jgi:hypothetical protein
MINIIADYLESYIKEYNKAFKKFILQIPFGYGYPKIYISPFLNTNSIDCYVCKDGVIIMDTSREPSYPWYLIGNAIMIDNKVSKKSKNTDLLLKKYAKGIYRVDSEKELDNDIWNGVLPKYINKIHKQVNKIDLNIYELNMDIFYIVVRLTFGFFLIQNFKFPEKRNDFWTPHIIRELGFFTADMKNKRFFNYAEIYPHIEKCAWDKRNIWARVFLDIKRDYSYQFYSKSINGGSISFGKPEDIEQRFYDHLTKFKNKIDEFENLLN